MLSAIVSNEIINTFENSIKLIQERDINSLHNSRKLLKRFRALIRLIKYAIPLEDYQTLNYYARDIARSIAQVRDFDSAIEACERNYDSLNSYYKNLTTRIKNKLIIHKNEFINKENSRENLNELNISVINQILKKTSFDTIPHKEIILAFARMYKKTKNQAYSLKANDDIFFFHEWRKNVKYLRYQSAFFIDFWPNYYNFLENELHSLSDILGNMQDNALVNKFIESYSLLKDISCEKYINLSIKINQGLKAESLIIGKRLFVSSKKKEIKKLELCCFK